MKLKTGKTKVVTRREVVSKTVDEEKRLWGVHFVAEKKSIKKKFLREDGSLDDASYARATEEEIDSALNEGPSLTQNIRKAHYIASIRVFDRVRYLGTTSTPQAAARLYDAALYHLWGFLKRPKARFNLWREKDEQGQPLDPPPISDSRLRLLKRTLLAELAKKNIAPMALDYTYAERETHE